MVSKKYGFVGVGWNLIKNRFPVEEMVGPRADGGRDILLRKT